MLLWQLTGHNYCRTSMSPVFEDEGVYSITSVLSGGSREGSLHYAAFYLGFHHLLTCLLVSRLNRVNNTLKG